MTLDELANAMRGMPRDGLILVRLPDGRLAQLDMEQLLPGTMAGIDLAKNYLVLIAIVWIIGLAKYKAIPFVIRPSWEQFSVSGFTEFVFKSVQRIGVIAAAQYGAEKLPSATLDAISYFLLWILYFWFWSALWKLILDLIKFATNADWIYRLMTRMLFVGWSIFPLLDFERYFFRAVAEFVRLQGSH